MAEILKGDFIGFTYGSYHSSDLGIVRTSNGNRFNEDLFPQAQDRTAIAAGRDGTYYWDTEYVRKNIPITFAFDDLDEKAVRKLKEVFNGREMQRLIFDETPFKYYMVKPNSGANIKYICFDENGERVYKGEGSVNFTAFYPYAKSRYKYLSEYNLTNIPEWKRDENDTDGFYKNLHEWEDTYMFKNKGTYDVAGTSILTYNAGDIETDFKLYVPFSANEEMTLTSVTNSCGLLTFFPITASGTDTHICLDSSTNLIEGIVEINDSYNKTGNLYNKFIQGGDFFKIPTGEDTLSINGAAAEKVEYDYLFL